MQDNELFNRIDKLHLASTYPLLQRLTDEYEDIHVMVGKILDTAKDQCWVLHTGTIQWPLAYKQACLQLKYWLNRIFYYKEDHRNIRKIIVLPKKSKLICNPNLNLQEVENEFKAAHKSRKKFKAIAESLSLEYKN